CVVSSEGFIVASVVPNEIDEDLIGGMAASLLGVGERIAVDLMRSQMEQVYVRSPKGYIVVNAIGSEASLVLLVTRYAKLGLTLLELKRTPVERAKPVACPPSPEAPRGSGALCWRPSWPWAPPTSPSSTASPCRG